MNAAKYVVFKDGQWWRWELRASNGIVMAKAGKKFSSRLNAQNGIKVLENLVNQSPITVFE